MLNKFLRIMRSHKVLTAFVILVIIIGGYSSYKNLKSKENGISYTFAEVKRGMITTSVSGSGQVAASNQIDIKSKVAGDVVYVGVKAGQAVKSGTLLVQIETSDAEKVLRDAETSLETAKLELDKLLEPPDELDLLMAENDLAQAKELKESSEDNVGKSYEDGFNTVSDAFLDLPTVISGLKSLLFDDDFISDLSNINYYANTVKNYDENALEYRDDAYDDYQVARLEYDQNFQSYKDASRYSEPEVIEALITETHETAKAIAEAVKSMNDLINFYKDILIENDLEYTIPSFTLTHQNTLDSYTGTTNNHLLSLLSIKSDIEDSKELIINIERDIAEKTESLAQLKAGADDLDIRTKEIAVQQREDDLIDAKQNLADHYITAPFDGVVAEINFKKGESISINNVAATFITNQKTAEITVNEVDVAGVEEGQKANIVFDAIEDLNITGQVIEIGTLGTASQGVVTYDIKIGFDVQDERVKSGMSISADIITNIKQNVLLVPNSTIKYQGDKQYVEVMTDNKNPQPKLVEIGLSNDTMTEIITGIQEGDKIVTQTINSNSSYENKGGFSPSAGSEMRIMKKIQ